MTGVVSITAKALGESKWTEQKNSAECRYLRPWRRRPRWIHLTFFARSDGGERCEVGVSLPHLSQFLLLHLEETEHTVMLLKSTSVHSAVWHWSKTSELWENWDTSRASSHLSCSEIRRKKMWLVILTLATVCVCLCRHGGETVTTNCLGWNQPNRWFHSDSNLTSTLKNKSQHIVWTAFTTTNW